MRVEGIGVAGVTAEHDCIHKHLNSRQVAHHDGLCSRWFGISHLLADGSQTASHLKSYRIMRSEPAWKTFDFADIIVMWTG